MIQERVIAKVRLRLQHCLERRDRPAILALTTWLVHRHGHPLLQRLLSQPEWSSHRLWWGEQISHPTPDLQPQSPPQPQARPKTTPPVQRHQDNRRDARTDPTDRKALTAAMGGADPWAEPAPPPQPQAHLKTEPADQQHQDDKATPMAAKGQPLEPNASPRQRPEPQDGFRLDGCPANRTESSDQELAPVNLTPAQVSRHRLKTAKAATIQEEEEGIPTVAQAANGKPSPKSPPNRKHHSHQLRDWLPRSRLPHQVPRQDAA